MTDRARTPPDIPPIEPGVRGANMLLMFVLEIRPANGWARVTLEVLWFGAGVAAFALAGQPGLGAALAILFVVNLALRRRWRQTPTLP